MYRDMVSYILVTGTGSVEISGTGSANVYTPLPYNLLAWGTAGDILGYAGVDVTDGVTDLAANKTAYAAIKSDGTIVTWGNATNGGIFDVPTTNGNYSSLVGFTQSSHLAALKNDGSVGIWGSMASVYYNTKVITKLVGNVNGFDGLAADATVVTWGVYPNNLGANNNNMVDVLSFRNVSASLKTDNTLYLWGNDTWGSNSTGSYNFYRNGVIFGTPGSVLAGVTSNIVQFSNSMSALLTDGSVVSWGGSSNYNATRQANKTGDLSSGVVKIFGSYLGISGSDNGSYIALKSDTSVVAWGSTSIAGVAGSLSSGVLDVFNNYNAFVAMKAGGVIVSWGANPFTGTNGNFVKIFSTERAFAGLKNDGSVLAWGDSAYGGDASGVAGSLSSDVIDIFPNDSSFAALKSDGSVITWGNASFGGNSSSVDLSSGVTDIIPGFNSFTAVVLA